MVPVVIPVLQPLGNLTLLTLEVWSGKTRLRALGPPAPFPPSPEFLGWLRLEDNLGTNYALGTAHSGGTAWEHEYGWDFEPELPEGVHTVTVIDAATGSRAIITVA